MNKVDKCKCGYRIPLQGKMKGSLMNIKRYFILCPECKRMVYDYTKREAVEAWNKQESKCP
jgi:hypothetical protein